MADFILVVDPDADGTNFYIDTNEDVLSSTAIKTIKMEVPSKITVTSFYSPMYLADFLQVRYVYKNMYHTFLLNISFNGIASSNIFNKIAIEFKDKYPEAHPAVKDYFINKIKNSPVDGEGLKATTKVEVPGQDSEIEENVSKASHTLPGMDVIVNYPCNCEAIGVFINYENSLRNIIMHLNDKDKWSREKIADWIDELHDKGIINAEFESWNEEPLDSDESVV